MAVDDIKMYTVSESERKQRNPLVGTRFSPGVENERSDADRDETCLVRPNDARSAGGA